MTVSKSDVHFSGETRYLGPREKDPINVDFNPTGGCAYDLTSRRTDSRLREDHAGRIDTSRRAYQVIGSGAFRRPSVSTPSWPERVLIMAEYLPELMEPSNLRVPPEPSGISFGLRLLSESNPETRLASGETTLD